MSKGDKAIVIRVNNRYFVKFGKNGRLQTGWSLASAKLFADWLTQEIEAVETKLTKKGYNPVRMTVTCSPEMDDSHEYIPTDPETGSIDFGAWEDLENARAAEEFEATGRRIKVRDFYASEKMLDDWSDPDGDADEMLNMLTFGSNDPMHDMTLDYGEIPF